MSAVADLADHLDAVAAAAASIRPVEYQPALMRAVNDLTRRATHPSFVDQLERLTEATGKPAAELCRATLVPVTGRDPADTVDRLARNGWLTSLVVTATGDTWRLMIGQPDLD